MRRTKAINYIQLMKNNSNPEVARAGLELEELYFKWKKSLDVRDLVDFVEAIEEKYAWALKKGLGRMPQSIGQFRAYALEEYIYDITSQVLGNDYRILWNEKIPVWEEEFEYSIAQDLAVLDYKGKLKAVVEAKVEVDAQRLKAVLMNFSLLKISRKPFCAIVYIRWNADEKLKFLARRICVDEIFDFNRNPSEVERYKKWISRVSTIL
ncbi:MAG: hypothetical protein DRJ37_07215 [Thermoprotei archaeon]|nr:MAG: hypothetical protein DRJ37_07215 [Thermoprotei archaeon]